MNQEKRDGYAHEVIKRIHELIARRRLTSVPVMVVWLDASSPGGWTDEATACNETPGKVTSYGMILSYDSTRLVMAASRVRHGSGNAQVDGVMTIPLSEILDIQELRLAAPIEQTPGTDASSGDEFKVAFWADDVHVDPARESWNQKLSAYKGVPVGVCLQLRALTPGTLFVDRSGCVGVKTSHRDEHGDRAALCVLLGCGDLITMPEGDDTPVVPIILRTKTEGAS